MITIANKKPTDRILELGGGDNPHPEADVCVDVRPGPRTHFTADFTQPLPIQDSDFTCVIAHFVLEHLPYRCVLSFLKECHRVLKSGGHAVFAVPNTAEQIKWINSHEGGWDGKPLFEAASELLYGSQNMPGGDEIDHNTHRVYFDPKIAALLFAEAGFVDVVVSPYGERNTDMTIQARKANPQPEVFKLQRREDTTVEQAVMKGLTAVAEQESVFVAPVVTVVEGEGDWGKLLSKVRTTPELPQTPQITISQGISETSSNELEPQAVQPSAYAPDPPAESVYGKNSPLIERPYGGRTVAEAFDLAVFAGGSVSEIMKTSEGRGRVFGKAYFNGGSEFGGYAREGYRDFPVHEITARHILARKPESVLELGCARGYILKRIQDARVYGVGLEVSRHCYLTRVCENIYLGDLCERPWVSGVRHTILGSRKIDLCYSVATLEHIPEQHVPNLIQQMAENCERGLHGIDFGGNDDGFDKTHVTLRDKSWWIEQFAKYAPGWPVEIVDKEELERGEFPKEVLDPQDGKVKLNVGSFTVMSMHGWINLDQHDLGAWAQANGCRFQRCDVKNGLPFDTASVDLLSSSHFVEHLSYADVRRFFFECRRVIKPGGVIRIAVPDAELLMKKYASGESLSEFDEMSDGCAAAVSNAAKLWSLLHEGHESCFDWKTLEAMLSQAGFVVHRAAFRRTSFGSAGKQILWETLDMFPAISLYVEATPSAD